MSFGFRLEVWGEYASFNRPEMKVERVSYEVMTPSAAKGILEAIYWKPQMYWVIDRIHVLAPIRFTHIRRNEIEQRIPAGNVESAMSGNESYLGIAIEEHRQQRAAMILRDVRYGIEAHLEVSNTKSESGEQIDHPEAKHLEEFRQRARKGQYFHHPYLGCREFPAHFRLLEDQDKFPPYPQELSGERDLGFMLWGILFIEDAKGTVVESNRGRRLRPEPRFFHARMKDGVIRIPTATEIGGMT